MLPLYAFGRRSVTTETAEDRYCATSGEHSAKMELQTGPKLRVPHPRACCEG